MSDARRERFGDEHSVFCGRGDGRRDGQCRVVHLLDEDGLVIVAGELDAGAQQRVVDPRLDVVANVASVRLKRAVREPEEVAPLAVELR